MSFRSYIDLQPSSMLLILGLGKLQRSIQQPSYAAWLCLWISFLLQVLTLAPASKLVMIRIHQPASGGASSMGNDFPQLDTQDLQVHVPVEDRTNGLSSLTRTETLLYSMWKHWVLMAVSSFQSTFPLLKHYLRRMTRSWTKKTPHLASLQMFKLVLCPVSSKFPPNFQKTSRKSTAFIQPQ